jgi:glycosyltransferase involved in cell wall biosynthesis
MLRVAVVTSYFPTSTQPWLGHSAYQTLKLLARMCDLHVFYPEASYPNVLRPAGSAARFDRSWNPPGVRCTYIPYPALPLLSRPFNGFMSGRALLPHVRAFDPDVVLNYRVYPEGQAAVYVARHLEVPVHLTAIGSDLNRIPNRMVGRIVHRTLRNADFVTTVSHDLCATAIRLGAPVTHTRAKLNGCDTSVFHPRDRREARKQLNLSQDDRIVVYVGRLDLRKGLLELIEAMAKLAPSKPRAHCYIVGDGADEPALVQAIVTHNARDCVTLVPPCVSSEIAVWMAAADLVTLPSYNEGCPNVVIEALSAGRPVVATNVGGIPELMDSSDGRLVPARDAAALSVALGEVLDQTWDAQAIADKRSRSWEDVARENLLILEWLVTRYEMPARH